MEGGCTFEMGEWIVHTNYGVGQIKSIETKCISGEDKRYYRVETADSTYWLPVEQEDSEVLRPLSSMDELKEAIEVIRDPAEEMSSNHKTRQSRMRRIQKRNTPRGMARLLRDLRAYKRKKKGLLNNTESSVLREVKQRFANEWAVVAGVSNDAAMSRLERLLDPRRSLKDENAFAGEKNPSSNNSEADNEAKWQSWPRRQTNIINR
jgi:RNA polymerase-interacting CarD/CdnL/TRCF family regulator